VESGEGVETTWRGLTVARFTRAAEWPAAGFDVIAFLALTKEQLLHTGSIAAALLQELLEGACY